MATTYNPVTTVTPITAFTNSDLIVLFSRFDTSGADVTLDATSTISFLNPGDVTIAGSDREQITLDIGGTFNYEINGTVSQGEISFPFNPDPNAGVPEPVTSTAAVVSTPEGVLYIGKIISRNESGQATSVKVWGHGGVNYLGADGVSMPKNNTASATARFKATGERFVFGYDKAKALMGSETGTITITYSA